MYILGCTKLISFENCPKTCVPLETCKEAVCQILHDNFDGDAKFGYTDTLYFKAYSSIV